MNNVYIKGTGSYAPENIIKNDFFESIGSSGEWIFSKLGIKERRISTGEADAVFFGDGAGAMVLSSTTEDKGFIDFALHSDGTGKEHFTILAGGSAKPASIETVNNREHYFKMDGKAVFDTATKVVPENINEILSKNNLTIEDVDFMLPHQPSIRILQEIARKVNLPFEKVKTNMDRYANTSGGTVPIILDETHKNNEFKKGDILLFAAVGAGWTWGTALYKW